MCCSIILQRSGGNCFVCVVTSSQLVLSLPSLSQSVLTSSSQLARIPAICFSVYASSFSPAVHALGAIRSALALNASHVGDSSPAFAQTLAAYSLQGPPGAAVVAPEVEGAAPAVFPVALCLHPVAANTARSPANPTWRARPNLE